MRFAELLRTALSSLRAHRFRSVLTVSTITLGAFSIVLMSSLAESGLTTLLRDLEELGGAKVIIIAPKKPERSAKKRDAAPGRISARDKEAVFAALPHVSAGTLYATLDRKDIANDAGKAARTDFVAADAGFFEVLGLKVAKGRLFAEEDDRRHARVCVVSFDVANTLWDGDAVGRWLTIDGDRCQVIGQLAKIDHWDTNFGFAWLDFVALPFQTAADTRPEVLTNAALQIRTDSPSSNDIVKRVANAILEGRHQGVDDYQIWDFNAFMGEIATMFTIMQAVVGLVAGIALVVGGVGVMNMMLVSVSERTREIGIRKALGAPPDAIAAQFLTEATALAATGGLVGTALGALLATVANVVIHRLQPLWIGEISGIAAAVAILASMAIGVGFGWLPARSASRLDPVVAMSARGGGR